MTTPNDLRVGVVGAGKMGADHVIRLTRRISGATVSAIIEPDAGRAEAALEHAPGAQSFTRIEDAIEQGLLDAVLIATPGAFHEPVLLPALDAGLEILEDKANLERAFEVLTRRERIILFLRFYESVSQTEIAKRLNVSQMHVSRLQQKALEKLKAVLKE